ncbi:MAG: S-layer homology domain-containing protein, partial [Oscillospiraceae bacterium]|nr:S-layer homology domain-containing protein [Oscillospiraceae bacterium]
MRKGKHYLNLLRVVTALLLTAMLACTVSAEATFSDVKTGDWFEPYVSALADAGVVSGFPDGSFLPGKTTTAGEALRLILGAAGVGILEPVDSHWASGYLWYCYRNGYLSPTELTDLSGGISRSLIAKVTACALGLDPVLDTASPFADTDDPFVQALFDAGILSGSFDSQGLRKYYPSHTIIRSEMSSVIYHVFDYVETRAKQPEKSDEDPDETDSGLAERPVGTLFGMDVSSHNGEINWRAAADAGVQFAMIRVGYRGYTEGKLYLDDRFRENLRGVMNAGLKVGVYFFSQAVTREEAVEEAEMLLDALDGTALAFPVVYDYEPMNYKRSRTKDLDAEVVTMCMKAFCRRVEQAGYV